MKNTDDKNADGENIDAEDADGEKKGAPSDFVVGLVTFIVFFIFMTVWMYYST